jgi:hypothetical protein
MKSWRRRARGEAEERRGISRGWRVENLEIILSDSLLPPRSMSRRRKEEGRKEVRKGERGGGRREERR